MNWNKILNKFKLAGLNTLKYELPNNPREMIFDYYMSTYFTLGEPKSEKIADLISYTRDTLITQLKNKLLEDVFFIVCAEFRHSFSEGRIGVDDLSQNEEFSKNEKDFYENFNFFSSGSFVSNNEKEIKGSRSTYDISYKKVLHLIEKQNIINHEEFINFAKKIFLQPKWEESFGGKPWANICQSWLNLYKAKSQGEIQKAIEYIVTLQHNTGTLFNKLKFYRLEDGFEWIKKTLDLKAKSKSPYDLLPYCSSRMKQIAPPIIKELFGTATQSYDHAIELEQFKSFLEGSGVKDRSDNNFDIYAFNKLLDLITPYIAKNEFVVSEINELFYKLQKAVVTGINPYASEAFISSNDLLEKLVKLISKDRIIFTLENIFINPNISSSITKALLYKEDSFLKTFIPSQESRQKLFDKLLLNTFKNNSSGIFPFTDYKTDYVEINYGSAAKDKLYLDYLAEKLDIKKASENVKEEVLINSSKTSCEDLIKLIETTFSADSKILEDIFDPKNTKILLNEIKNKILYNNFIYCVGLIRFFDFVRRHPNDATKKITQDILENIKSNINSYDMSVIQNLFDNEHSILLSLNNISIEYANYFKGILLSAVGKLPDESCIEYIRSQDFDPYADNDIYPEVVKNLVKRYEGSFLFNSFYERLQLTDKKININNIHDYKKLIYIKEVLENSKALYNNIKNLVPNVNWAFFIDYESEPIGAVKYYFNKKIHREDGPAIEYEDGQKYYFIHGINYSEEEFTNEIYGPKHTKQDAIEIGNKDQTINKTSQKVNYTDIGHVGFTDSDSGIAGFSRTPKSITKQYIWTIDKNFNIKVLDTNLQKAFHATEMDLEYLEVNNKDMIKNTLPITEDVIASGRYQYDPKNPKNNIASVVIRKSKVSIHQLDFVKKKIENILTKEFNNPIIMYF